MPSVRSFIALPTADSVKDRIATILAELIQLNADVKWDSSEKFHITLKFLGSVEPQVLEKLIPALATIASVQTSFDLTFQELGGFPNLEQPRVLWVGTSNNESLLALQRHVEETCVRFGFPKEQRAFHPHITLGRVKGTRNIHRLTDRLKSITFDPTNSRCAELLVMRSDLHPSGSVYSVLKSIPFKS
ncbi:MAG: RNA 2',3'-cyclic phosphodiesterase [Bacteroidota bacterium]